MSNRKFSFLFTDFQNDQLKQKRSTAPAFSNVNVLPLVASLDERHERRLDRFPPTSAFTNTYKGPLVGTDTCKPMCTPVTDTPSLPRRNGLRNVLMCIMCMWTWVMTVIALCLVYYRRESAPIRIMAPNAMSSEGEKAPTTTWSDAWHCSMSILSSEQRPSRLQIHLSLATLLSGYLYEEDIVVQQPSPGFYQIDIYKCTEQLRTHFGDLKYIHDWNELLERQYNSHVSISRPLHVIATHRSEEGNTTTRRSR